MTLSRNMWAVALTAAFSVSACGGAAEEAGDAASDADAPTAETEAGVEMPAGHDEMGGGATALTYECADDRSFTLTMLDGAERARIEIDGETHDLEAAPTDAGMGYVGGEIEFRGMGTAATVNVGGETVFVDCEATGHEMQ